MSYESRLSIVIDSRSAQGSLKRLESDLGRTQAAGEKAFSGLQKGAMAFGAAFAAIGAGAAFKSTISTIVDFQTEVSGLQAVARASVEDLARLEQQARLLGATTAYGANQAAQAQKFLAQGGLEVNEILGATPEVMRLAQAGMLGLGEAADLATDVLEAMSLRISDIGRIGNVLVATSQAATTDVSALGEALSYSAGQSANFGLSLEETVAALGRISGTGAKGSRAGTSLVAVFARLSNISSESVEMLKRQGIAISDLDIEARGFIPVLETLAGANLSATESQKLFGETAAAGANALIKGLPAYREQIAALQEVDGLAQQAAETMTNNLGGAFKGLGSAIAESNLQLGDSGLTKTLDAMIKTGTGVVQIFNGMGDEWAAGTQDGEKFLATAQSLVSTLEVLAIVGGARLTTALLSAAGAQMQGVTAAQARLTAEASAASAVARRTAAEALAEKRLLGRAMAEARATQGTAAHTAALNALNIQRQRSIQASAANTVAINAEAAAMNRASVAARGLAVAGRAATSALTLVGGPLGLLIGAGGLLYAFRDELNITSQRVGLTEEQVMDFRSELSGLANDSFTGILSDLHAELDAATLKAAHAREELAALRAERTQGEGARAMFQTLERGGYEAELNGLRAVEQAEGRIIQINQRLAAAKGEVASRIEQSANAMVVYGERVETTADQTRLASEATNKLSDATKAANEAERERQRVLDDSISAYADLNKQLSPAGAAMADYNDTVARLTVAYEAGTKSALEYYAAIGQAARNYNEAVRAADPNIKRVEDLSNQYDRAFARGQQLTKAIDDINAAYRRGDVTGEQYTRMIGNVRDEMQQLALEADPAAQEMARAWEEASNRIDETFADAFAGAFDSFDSFADQLLDGFKRLLSELAYQATLKPIVVGFTQDIQGLMQGGRGGFGNTIGAAHGVFSAGSSLMGSGASAGGLYANAATGSAIGSAGIMSSITAGVSAAMPWIAGGLAIDSLLGGKITGAISGLFGSETKPRLNVSTYGSADQFGHDSYAQGAFGAVGFSRGTRRSDELFGGIEQEREWLASVAAMDDMLASVARSPEQLDAMTQAANHFIVTAGNAQSATDMLSNRTLHIAGVIDNQFAGSLRGLGLSAEEVTSRVVTATEAMRLVESASGRLNLQYDASAQNALSLADALAQYAGGVENLANIQQAYYQAVFSDNERMQHSLEDVRGSLNALTSENITSVEHLRRLVEAQNLNSEAGQRLAYDLMALAPALAQSNEAVKDAIRQQYQSALGREADAVGLAYWFSQITNGALSLRGALDNIAASSDKATDAANGTGSAIDNAANILREREQLERQLLTALGDTEELRRRELAALDPSNRAIQERLYAIQDERDYLDGLHRQQEERIRTINQERDAMARAREQWQSLGNSIQGWIDGLNASDAGLGTPREQLDAADSAFWAQYEKALGGDRNAQQSITQYADRYAENLREMYASGTGAVNGIDEIRDALLRLPEQLTPEDFLADEFRKAIDEQTERLTNILDLNSDGVVSAIERSTTAEWSATDRLNSVIHQEMRRLGTTVLTESQVRAALRPHATDAEINRLIARVDRNGDGLISRQELTNARLDALGGGIAKSLLPLFSEIDLDASGLIDYGEFSRAFDGMATDETLSQIFGLIDANGDGQLSYLEAIASSSSTLVQLWAKQQPASSQSAISDITKMYERALGRAPDLPGLQYWINQWSSGASLSTIEQSIQQHVGRDPGGKNSGSSSSGGKKPRPFWDRVADASMSKTNREWMEHFKADNRIAEAERLIRDAGIKIPAYATGAWDLPGDHLAQVHQGEFIAPSAGGIADEFRAYASGNYHAELMGEMGALRADVAPALHAFPLLNFSDVTQVMRDMQRTIERQGQQLARLLGEGNQNTRDTANATAKAAQEARRQRDAQLRETENQSRTMRLQKRGALA
ncbi:MULTISPECIES: phage tail tape measure protein [unclassified Halomonas]|uniref:phage tail tape measure protein n=1 Tax=unclassified Halomonas TaxID=2609666 RepID=UPI00207690FE|nr:MULTISPECIES: phage tail tape measure protein [unclassified Halomonas]